MLALKIWCHINKELDPPRGITCRSLLRPFCRDSHDWTTASFFSQRSYAVQADLETNIAPTFTNLPTTKSYVDKTPATTIMAVSVTDDNTGDLASLSTAIVTHSDKFDIASNSITTKASWTWAVGTYDVIVVVTDQCGNSATSTATIIIENSAPDISSLPSSSDLSEEVTSETNLKDLTVTDMQTYTCAINDVTPASGSANSSLSRRQGLQVYDINQRGPQQ
uniref:Uncharacterized protein LOC111108109 n=1 Tax=Crassostrea virginica TaxID=6565 RepID=A0A8B8B7J7_CRAVI|nr:uncharacterized protein LOC111108109 [Crassostrea virginica]